MSQGSSIEKRLLILAFSVHPDKNMEDRNGWHRALQAARNHCVVVICGPMSNISELNAAVPSSLKGRIEFVPIRLNAFCEYCLSAEKLFYFGYRNWLANAKRAAIKMHAQRPFVLSHLVSLCGYREIGEFWQIGCPSIIGPIGGTSGFRIAYLTIVDWFGGTFEVLRNAINAYQARYSNRIRRAIGKSAVVIAANSSTRNDLQHYALKPIRVSLEAGIDYPVEFEKAMRLADEPLKILWAGRLRTWKALPLLLYAIAELPSDVQVSLRVVGDGKCERSWKRLAESLGIAQKIEWNRRPAYRDSLRFYRDADLFAFTSLRDTSGTGLLESLTAGTPILALNHQGAADIVTEQCGVPISVRSPRQSITEFRDAIVSLAQDPVRLKSLSDGALIRSQAFQWSSYEEPMNAIYGDAIKGVKS